MREYGADQDQEYVPSVPFPRSSTLTNPRGADKDSWINLERLRWAQHFSIPITTALPPDFPAPSLPIMRALSAIAVADDGNQTRVVQALDAFYSQYWEHAVATHQPEVLKETLVGLFGADETERSESCCSIFSLHPSLAPQEPPTSNRP